VTHPFVGRYMAAVGGGDADAVAVLFSDDAEFFHPLGVARGKAEILAFYRSVLAKGGLPARPGLAFDDGNDLLFEIVLRDGPPEEGPFAMDHVTFDPSGLATRMVAMIRPGAPRPDIPDPSTQGTPR
jgi:hypothetical protein